MESKNKPTASKPKKESNRGRPSKATGKSPGKSPAKGKENKKSNRSNSSKQQYK